jgi:hypothetical protein
MAPAGGWFRGIAGVLGVYLLVTLILGMYWSLAPGAFDVQERAETFAAENNSSVVTGSVTAVTLIAVAETLLDKPGGFIRNDLFPPGLWLDNMPNWEYGALIQVRDLSRAMRESYSRSQSQSKEDVDLAQAEPLFNFKADSWMLPASEREYREGIRRMKGYTLRLANPAVSDAQFYARADNLAYWLATVETRLGSLSQRLSASVGQRRINTDLAGDAVATQATPAPRDSVVSTPWLEIDDVFYAARGSTWALIHFLRAAEIDFADVLEKKNARVSLQQIIRELEATQQTVWSPIVLNGSGFGLVANHSLVMASYISRANAGIIDLRRLLSEG